MLSQCSNRVSRVRTSMHDPGTAWVTKSGMRFDTFAPRVYVTRDYGETWTARVAGLPDSAVNVIFEDPRSRDVLYLGNERGVHVTLDGGRLWRSFAANVPTDEPPGFAIHYRLPEDLGEEVVVTVHDAAGEERARLSGGSGAGMHRVHWNTADVEGLEAGRLRVSLHAAGCVIKTFASLEPPRAFPVGRIADRPLTVVAP